MESEDEPIVLSITVTFNVVTPTPLGSVYFGEHGCLANIEPHFEETGLLGLVLQSREEHVMSSIACTLENDPTVGSHVPRVVSTMGLLVNSEDIEEYDVEAVIIRAMPNTDLNLLAQDNVTIEGTGLPHDLTNNAVRMYFND